MPVKTTFLQFKIIFQRFLENPSYWLCTWNILDKTDW